MISEPKGPARKRQIARGGAGGGPTRRCPRLHLLQRLDLGESRTSPAVLTRHPASSNRPARSRNFRASQVRRITWRPARSLSPRRGPCSTRIVRVWRARGTRLDRGGEIDYSHRSALRPRSCLLGRLSEEVIDLLGLRGKLGAHSLERCLHVLGRDRCLRVEDRARGVLDELGARIPAAAECG
jgi:hypothetical protein